MSPEGEGVTYADAGVSLEAADESVERLKAHVGRATRKEVLSGIGGAVMRRCTSFAPDSRSMATSWREVLPRTIESSTTTRRLPSMMSRRGLSLRRMPSSRSDGEGWMKVRPT